MNLSDAQLVSANIKKHLDPHCLRCEVAGSIRRCDPNPGDIDIVLIPSPAKPKLIFGQKEPPHPSMLERTLWQLEQARMIEKVAGGPKLKKYTLELGKWGVPSLAVPVTVKMQITIATPDNWAYWYLIRTGPQDFSRWIVTEQNDGGAIPDNMYYGNFHLHRQTEDKSTFEVVDTPDESDWLTALGLPWVEPKDRRAPWKRKV